eukprot:1157957-Pelagomonas_calceolata.AAC.8
MHTRTAEPYNTRAPGSKGPARPAHGEGVQDWPGAAACGARCGAFTLDYWTITLHVSNRPRHFLSLMPWGAGAHMVVLTCTYCMCIHSACAMSPFWPEGGSRKPGSQR